MASISDDISIYIFMNAKFLFWLKLHWSLFLIDSNPALVEIMAWRQIGDKPLCEAMFTWFNDAYMRHMGKMS